MPAYQDYCSLNQIVQPQLLPQPKKSALLAADLAAPTALLPVPQHQPEYICLSQHPSSTNLYSAAASRSQPPNINTLPPEILTQILQEAILANADGNPSNYSPTTSYFTNLLTTCAAFYDVGIPILYRHVAFSDPYTFDKFRRSIQCTGYGVLTRTLDFSGFTSVGLGRTARMNDEIQMLTANTINNCLDLCPNLNEFLACENIEKDMDERVLTKLLTEMPFLSALDFCGATDAKFVRSLTAAVTGMSRSHVTRLSLHSCSTLSPDVLRTLLGKLPNLHRLDLTHTQVTSDALLALPETASLTHLSLSKCVRLSSQETLKFLVLHPATRQLEWLNMLFDVTRPAPISSTDLKSILRYLPPLRYLNLHGLPIRKLDPLVSMNLQSLSLGYSKFDVETLQAFLPKLPNLEYIDLSGNPHIDIWTAQNLELLNANPNIKMFEFSMDLLQRLVHVRVSGFSVVMGQGRRGWFVRNQTVAPTPEPVAAPSAERERFSFAKLAETRIRNRSASPEVHKVVATQPKQELLGTPFLTKASRKINVCFVGIGGNMTVNACRERGIYLYYGYKK